MRHGLWVTALLSVVTPAALAPGQPPAPIPPGRPAAGPNGAAPGYVPPTAGGPVVVLLDEGDDALFPLMNNVVGEPGTVAREGRDAFAGVDAARVTPLQKYQARVPGWAFRVAGDPKAGEYRYARFAWKKVGGTGVMVQFHDADRPEWRLRYFAGRNAVGWEARSAGGAVPREWQLVTRDLFADFGAATVSGIALTAMDGEAGLFDHVLLGRTVADLDRATDDALGRPKPAAALGGKERDGLWDDLGGPDRKKAAAALRAFLATAPDQVGYVGDRLPRPDPAVVARARKLVAAFGADAFDARQAATAEVVRLGPAALPAVREAAKSADAEVAYRAGLVLQKLGDDGQGTPLPSRVVRVLERAATPAARDLLTRLAAGRYGADYEGDAAAALARLGPPGPRP
jgi:hypothetical protein